MKNLRYRPANIIGTFSSKNPQLSLLIAAVALLSFLVISFTLPFNQGLFSEIFTKTFSQAASLVPDPQWLNPQITTYRSDGGDGSLFLNQGITDINALGCGYPCTVSFDLSAVPSANRQNIRLFYNAQDQNTQYDVSNYTAYTGVPGTYQIQTNTAAGGTQPPSTGWVNVASENASSLSEHTYNFAGANWVRMVATAAAPGEDSGHDKLGGNFDFYNGSASADAGALFMGDSITLLSAGHYPGDDTHNSFWSKAIYDKAGQYPLMVNEGIGGTTSDRCTNGDADSDLAISPGKYAVFSFGMNDANGGAYSPSTFQANMQQCVNKALALGKIPVLPHITYTTNTNYNAFIPGLNSAIDTIVANSGGKVLAGPDFYTYFQQHTNLLRDTSSNGDVHPNSQGMQAIELLWENWFLQNVWNQPASNLYPDPNVSASPTPSPSSPIKHVITIIFENNQWSNIKGSSFAPYINSLLTRNDASYATQYHGGDQGNLHPSEPNYVWLEAGTNSFPDYTFTSDDDTIAQDGGAGGYNLTTSTQHLTTLLSGKGLTWKSYQESKPAGCPVISSGTYGVKHDPVMFFQDVVGNPPNTNNQGACNNNVNLTQLTTDLTNNTLANYNYVTPNLCDDMHGDSSCNNGCLGPGNTCIADGDTWLKNNLPAILNSSSYQNGNTAVFITWDEAENLSGGDNSNPVGMILLGKGLTKGNGYNNTTTYDHSSYTKTIENIFDLSPYIGNTPTATDLSDLFQPNVIPQLSTPTPSPTLVPPVLSGTLLVQDTFSGRTVSGGWGTASDGNAWTLHSGSSSLLSVSSNEGKISGNSSMTEIQATLGNQTATDEEVLVRYSSADYNNDEGKILLRYSGTGTYYSVGIDSPNSSPEVNIYKVQAGSSTRETGSPINVTSNQFYWERVRVQTQGSSAILSVKEWLDGTQEPTNWNITYTDTTPLVAGKVGIVAWDNGNGWNMDHFEASNLSSSISPTPSPTSTSTPTPSVTPTPMPTNGLHVSGNRILDKNNNPVHLVGVNHSGTEYACSQGSGAPYGWGLYDHDLQTSDIQAILSWHVNVVRIPLNEDCWLGINGIDPQFGGVNYQSYIQGLVSRLRQAGLYVILDLHWSAPGTIVPQTQQSLPDTDHSITFWQQVASAYKGDAGVIFDLFNEPFIYTSETQDPNQDVWTCWLNGCGMSVAYENGPQGYKFSQNWQSAGIQTLVNTVRSAGASNLIIAGGVDWANDITGWLAHKPVDPDNNIAISWHAYPGQPQSDPNGNPTEDLNLWNTNIAPIAAQIPIVVGETGDNVTSPITYVNTFLPWADAHGLSYLGWTWNAWGDPSNVLIQDYNGTPSANYGLYFHDHLLSLGPLPTPSPSTCPSKTGDFNNSGHVDLTDLSIFASSYGTSSPNIPNPCTDINSDGHVNLTDLSLFASVYGT